MQTKKKFIYAQTYVRLPHTDVKILALAFFLVFLEIQHIPTFISGVKRYHKQATPRFSRIIFEYSPFFISEQNQYDTKKNHNKRPPKHEAPKNTQTTTSFYQLLRDETHSNTHLRLQPNPGPQKGRFSTRNEASKSSRRRIANR